MKVYCYTSIPLILIFGGISGVESLFLMNFKSSVGDGRQNSTAPDSRPRPQPWGQAPGIEVAMPGGGRAPAGNGEGVTEKCDQASSPAPGWCHRDAGGPGRVSSRARSLRQRLHCVSEVEFDPCGQLIWTFLAWIICLAVSTDQINWIIAKTLLSCAPLGSWCSQQDGVGLQGQARLEN